MKSQFSREIKNELQFFYLYLHIPTSSLELFHLFLRTEVLLLNYYMFIKLSVYST